MFSNLSKEFKIYEKLWLHFKNVKSEINSRPKIKSKIEFKNKSRSIKPDIQCYNCGNKNHKSINCRNREKDPLWFSYNLYGHNYGSVIKQNM